MLDYIDITKTIKPCPNCKHSEVIIKSRYRKGTANRLMYWVECSYCGLSQKHDDLSGFRTKEKAVKHWNATKGYTYGDCFTE